MTRKPKQGNWTTIQPLRLRDLQVGETAIIQDYPPQRISGDCRRMAPMTFVQERVFVIPHDGRRVQKMYAVTRLT